MSSINLHDFFFTEGQNKAICLLSSYHYFFMLKIIVTSVKVTFKIRQHSRWERGTNLPHGTGDLARLQRREIDYYVHGTVK